MDTSGGLGFSRIAGEICCLRGGKLQVQRARGKLAFKVKGGETDTLQQVDIVHQARIRRGRQRQIIVGHDVVGTRRQGGETDEQDADRKARFHFLYSFRNS